MKQQFDTIRESIFPGADQPEAEKEANEQKAVRAGLDIAEALFNNIARIADALEDRNNRDPSFIKKAGPGEGPQG